MSKNLKPLSIFDETTDRLLPTVACTVFQLDVTAPVTNVTEQENISIIHHISIN